MDRVYVMQLVRSFQVGELSRRTFLKRATATMGSAVAANMLLAACQPIRPETPPPVVEEAAADAGAALSSAEGIIAGTVEYPDADGETLTGHLAQPEGDGPFPAILVIQEWWGLDNHIRDVTNRFAHEGFVALAPDLYHGVSTTEPDEARKLVMELDMEEAVREIRSGFDYVLALDSVAGDTVGIVGFCMGGRLVLATSLADDRLGAAVAFYGTPLAPEEAAGVHAPILGIYGENDGGIPVDSVLAMGDALTDAGIENEIYVYEGAEHAFFNDTRPSYHADASADAWAKTLAWFRERLPSA